MPAMGLLDDLKQKAGELGDKAKDGFEAAREKAENLVDDAKDRLDGDDEPAAAPTTESSDIAPDVPATEGFTVTDNRGPVEPV